jgi:hypothetical protein
MTDETLFHEVLAQPPPERAGFLDWGCAGQPQLHAAYEDMKKQEAQIPPQGEVRMTEAVPRPV